MTKSCSSPISRRALLALAPIAGVGMLAGVAPSATAQRTDERIDERIGEVAALRGAATAEKGGKARPLAVAEALFAAETIETGPDARITLRLGSTTTIKLGGAAKLRIDRFLADAGGEFDLMAGAIVFDRERKPPRGETIIRSAYGLMAVRGTRFFAGPIDTMFGVFVDHGLVVVQARGRAVTLTNRLGTDIVRPGARPSTAVVWGASRIAVAMASVE